MNGYQIHQGSFGHRACWTSGIRIALTDRMNSPPLAAANGEFFAVTQQ
jgi:hypothetical protein